MSDDNARIAALEAQITLCLRDNAHLISRIVELEHERDTALTTIRIARQRLYDADGREPETVAQVIRAVGRILRRDDDPAETPVPPPTPTGDALSSVASQLAVMIIQERLAAGHPITFASDNAPPRAYDPGRLCDHCGKPLVSAHIADETVITDGARQVRVHHVCMSAYPGWTVVATVRGGS